MKLYDDPESSNTCVGCLAIISLMHNAEFSDATKTISPTSEQPKISPHNNFPYFSLNVETYFKLKYHYLAIYGLVKFLLGLSNILHTLHSHAKVTNEVAIYVIYIVYAQAT